MANPILDTVARNINEITQKIEDAQELLNAMKEAGEEVFEYEQQLQQLRIKREKWSNMLKARGINV